MLEMSRPDPQTRRCQSSKCGTQGETCTQPCNDYKMHYATSKFCTNFKNNGLNNKNKKNNQIRDTHKRYPRKRHKKYRDQAPRRRRHNDIFKDFCGCRDLGLLRFCTRCRNKT